MWTPVGLLATIEFSNVRVVLVRLKPAWFPVPVSPFLAMVEKNTLSSQLSAKIPPSEFPTTSELVMVMMESWEVTKPFVLLRISQFSILMWPS